MTPADLATTALASYRATRLVVQDEIFERPRDAVTSWLDKRGHEKLMTLIACPFCMGVWCSIGVLVLRRHRRGEQLINLLAIAGLQSLMSLADAKMEG